MAELALLRKCDLCGKSDENLSVKSANHKELGWIKVCRDCWSELYIENRMVTGSSGSTKTSSSPCSSCSNRCF